MFAACIAVFPALLPGADAYLDNAPHLVELNALARDALGRGRWPAWSDQAELGFAAGELNAPLFWAPLAALVWAGLPAAGVWSGAILLSNVVFGLGVLRLGRILFGDDRLAGTAAALAVAAPADLYGLAGAAGGMVPFRLFSGIFFAFALDPRLKQAPALALWNAALLLGHSFTGVVGAAWTGLSLLFGVGASRRQAALGLTLAAGITAFYWAPLLASGLTPFGDRAPDPLLADRASLLLFSVFDLDLTAALFGQRRPIGGLPGALFGGLSLLGLLLALRRRPPPGADPGQRRLLLFGLGLGALIILAGPAAGAGPLGPNPWRYLSFTRQILLVFAGAGLATLPAALALVPAGLALIIGWAEVPSRLRPEAAAARAALDHTWDLLHAATPSGRIYVDDPFLDPGAPLALAGSHATLIGAGELRTVGCWYGVNALWTWDHTHSEGEAIFGEPAIMAGDSERLGNLIARSGVGGAILASPTASAAFAAVPGMRALGGEGGFSAFIYENPLPPPIRVRGSTVHMRALEPGLLRADVETSTPRRFVVERGWHPGWRASLDGRPLPLLPDHASGLLMGELPTSGRLELRWTPGAPWAAWVSGLAALVALAARRGRDPR